MKKCFILASASPWRKRLLKRHGIDARIHISRFEEIKSGRPEDIVLYNACGKAAAIASHYKGHAKKNAIIIGVDTIGVLRGKILGKPEGREGARKMLKSMAGTTHRVISGLCVIDMASGKMFKTAVTTKITFNKISESELEKYLDSGHWKGKAGSYAIQGRARKFLKKIDGDVTNVIGLPIPTFKKILEKVTKKN